MAISSGDQNTGIQTTLLKANAIAILPAEREHFAAGEEIDIQLRDDKIEPALTKQAAQRVA